MPGIAVNNFIASSIFAGFISVPGITGKFSGSVITYILPDVLSLERFCSKYSFCLSASAGFETLISVTVLVWLKSPSIASIFLIVPAIFSSCDSLLSVKNCAICIGFAPPSDPKTITSLP